MALDYLGIPASSVSSEEVNSKVKENFEGRDCLLKCTFRAEMCTRSWMNVLEEAGVTLLDDFNAAFQELEINVQDMITENDVIDYIVTGGKHLTAM